MKHQPSKFTDEELIKLCEPYKHSKDVPRWLYNAIHKRGLQKKAHSHMINLNPKRNFEEVKLEARKYKYRGEFQKMSNWAYQWARKHNVLDEVCSHMKIKGNLKERCIYCATFDDGYAYVGLTWETKDRWYRHMNPTKSRNSPIFVHFKETGLKPFFEQLTDYMPAEEAKKLEKEYIKEFAQKWEMLNSSKGGELGSKTSIWSKKNVYAVVYKCHSYKEFHEEHTQAYETARKNGWLEDIQTILPKEREDWTEEHIEEVLKNCVTLNEASLKYGGALNAAKVLGIYDKVTARLQRKRNDQYTIKDIEEYTRGLTFKMEFIQGNRSMVNAAIRMGIYDRVTSHLLTKPRGKTLEEYVEISSSYHYRSDFKKDHPGAYAVIIEKGWEKECFKHMDYKCSPKRSDEQILEKAKEYESLSEWKEKSYGSYIAAKKRGLFEIAKKHMHRPTSSKKKPDAYYIEKSANYDDLKLFRKECPNEYAAIVKRGKEFLDLCTKHMNRRKHSYTKVEAFAIGKKYGTKMQLRKAVPSVYHFLRNQGWLDECFPVNSRRCKK